MDFLEKVSKEKGIPKDEIQKKIDKKFQDLKEQNPDKNETKLKARAATEVKHSLANSGTYSSVKGLVIGKTEPFDMLMGQKRKAKQAYEQDPELALAKGLTDEDGAPLWTPDTYSNISADDNRIGKRLPSKHLIQTLYFIDLEDNSISKITTSDNEKVNQLNELEQEDVFEGRLLEQEVNEIPRQYGMGAQTTLEEVDEDNNTVEILEETGTRSLSELREYIKSTPEMRDRDRVVITSGFVEYMNLETEGDNSRRVVIDEAGSGEERGITLWLSPHIPVDFGRNSIVYAIGSVSLGSPWGDSPEKPVQMNVLGLIPDPDFTEPLDQSY